MLHGASSKNFWKFFQPFFSNETTSFDDRIVMVKKKKWSLKMKK